MPNVRATPLVTAWATAGAALSLVFASALPAAAAPGRVVSLDYCADQYVLSLVPRGDILALSPDAAKDFSYLRTEAAGLPQVRPGLEDVIALRPDVVVRSYGGGPQAAAAFGRLEVSVVQIGYANDLDGVRRVTAEVAAALGRPERGAAVIAEIDARLAALPEGDGASVLYLTQGGVTSGPGSLIDAAITAAGKANFEARPGWRTLPLERLARERPDGVAAAFFDARVNTGDVWTAARHPVARRTMSEADLATLDAASVACGGWFVLDAIEAIAAAGPSLRPDP